MRYNNRLGRLHSNISQIHKYTNIGDVLMYKTVGGILLMVQNATMRVYGISIKCIMFYVKKKDIFGNVL